MQNTVIFCNHKGGVGKSTLAAHLAWAGQEKGLKVLVADCDPQADIYAHFSGSDDPEQGASYEWAPGCHVMWWPGAERMPSLHGYDLVVVDLPPKVGLPPGLPGLCVIPVDGPFAIKNAADLLGSTGLRCVLVANGLAEGGRSFEALVRESLDRLPSHARLCPVSLVRGGSIRRSAHGGVPAWRDMWAGQAGERIQQWAQWLLHDLKAA